MNTLILLLAAVAETFTISGHVKDRDSGESLPAALVVVSHEGAPDRWSTSDNEGVYKVVSVPRGRGRVNVTYMGYHTLDTVLNVTSDLTLDLMLKRDETSLKEVVVTATEGHGVTASTVIRQDAISHIQPSSFADLLELLPGGMAKDPVLSSPQLINLRSANALTNSNYATSALGTKFMIDGRPIGNDANLQQTPGYSNLGSSYVDFGTDMREITTEDIESVNIVRGIAPVEYGDLTSGLVKIERVRGSSPLHARFKADMGSKLFYAGKGWDWGEKSDRTTLNASVNFLDSRADPREPRQNWKRLTGSVRAGRSWTGSNLSYSVNGSFDYTGSFDNEKSDEDLDTDGGGRPIETYRSNYNKMAAAGEFTMTNLGEGFFRSWATTASLTYEKDLISRWKHVTNGTASVISTSTEPGEFDALIIPSTYDARLKVDGQPFYAYINTTATFSKGGHEMKAGAEWTMDKNYGGGTIFDKTRPFNEGLSVRPRAYSDIPATHQLSAFVQEDWKKAFGNWKAELMGGVRMETMAGAGGAYSVNMKPYFDPRANLRVDLPGATLGGYRLSTGFYGGAGWHSKFPTMDQLYPDPLYGDNTELNYWPVEENLRRILLAVYKIDPTNYDLKAARNLKTEIGMDASWNGFSFSADWFREDMKSGFRYSSEYMTAYFKDYDEGAIDKSSLTGPPSVEGLPYVPDTLLTAYSYTTNGSRTVKTGLEFTFYSKRINPIHTKISINGAYFVTRYMNSEPEYYRPSIVISGKQYPYVGIYDKNDGSKYKSLVTNTMFDTQIPRLGLIFSTSFQCQWIYRYYSELQSKYPLAYIDKTSTRHDYTEEDKDDWLLGRMARDVSASAASRRHEPFYMNINLKVMKKLYHDKVSCSLFVNRIFDVTPDYWRNGVKVRRSQTPYFGMELDFKI